MSLLTKFFLWLWALTAIGPAWYCFENISPKVGRILIGLANMAYGVMTVVLGGAVLKKLTEKD